MERTEERRGEGGREEEGKRGEERGERDIKHVNLWQLKTSRLQLEAGATESLKAAEMKDRGNTERVSQVQGCAEKIRKH